ncbi:FGGY family carbohydrate kinase [Deinococcus hohokamensis]|uniref:FGGY family carbohydrate kinase n=1 Tax=Deinococcus hohokamensis TaxID=309883 RepID=A0ABV9ICU4_9DEIO
MDIGKGSSKGVLSTAGGQILGRHTVPHGISVPHPGWVEQDADEVWWHDFCEIARALLSGPYRPQDVAGVAVSTSGPCLLLDRSGRPLRPGILCGVDTRGTPEIPGMEAACGAQALYTHSGMALTSQAVSLKVRWLQRHGPDLWAQTAMLTTASSHVTFRLTGRDEFSAGSVAQAAPIRPVLVC